MNSLNIFINTILTLIGKYFIYAFTLTSSLLIFSLIISTNNKYIKKSNTIYECGATSFNKEQFTINSINIKTAILFVIFELELLFLIPTFTIKSINLETYPVLVFTWLIVLSLYIDIYTSFLDYYLW